MITPAESMKRLRAKRLKNGLCTRCGKPSGGKPTCKNCKDHIKEFMKQKRKEKHKTIRKLKCYSVENNGLYDELISSGITTTQLAKDLNVSSRSVLRWIFGKDVLPIKENIEKINKYFNKDIYIL